MGHEAKRIYNQLLNFTSIEEVKMQLSAVGIEIKKNGKCKTMSQVLQELSNLYHESKEE